MRDKHLSYLIDAKEPLFGVQRNPWDVFISAYNDSRRVRAGFQNVAWSDDKAARF